MTLITVKGRQCGLAPQGIMQTNDAEAETVARLRDHYKCIQELMMT